MFPKIQDPDDIWMRKFCQRPRLLFETLEDTFELCRWKGIVANDLDRNIALQPSIIRFIHRCHAALAKLLEDMIAPDGLVKLDSPTQSAFNHVKTTQVSP